MSSDALKSRSPAELHDAIGQLHALESAVLYQKLELLRAYDQTDAWRDDGATSMAAWVSYALGVTTTTGMDYVRVVRALAYLPLLAAALGEGRLCFEQVRALVKVATPESEAELVVQAMGRTATQVEAMVRGLRAVPNDEAAEANRRRSLRFRWRTEDRTLRLTGCLPDVDGAVVESAIVGLAAQSLATPDDPDREPWDARCADALVELASCALASDPEPQPGAEEGAHAGPESGAEAVGKADMEAGIRAGADAEAGGGAGAETETGEETDAEGEAQSRGGGELGVEPEAEAGTGLESRSGPDTEAGDGQGDGETYRALSKTAGVQAEPGTVPAKTRKTDVHVSTIEGEAVRAEIVVHVEAEALASGGEGVAALECGAPLASETVRRLACDALIQAAARGADGRPLGVGRRRRTVPRSLLRVLRHRDGGCRFPGCTRTRWVHAHHRHHWADGGPTDLDNLVTLCGTHHRFVHEGGWRIEGDPAAELRFVSPEGRELRVGPPGLRPEMARRLDAVPWLPSWIEWTSAASGRTGPASPDRTEASLSDLPRAGP